MDLLFMCDFVNSCIVLFFGGGGRGEGIHWVMQISQVLTLYCTVSTSHQSHQKNLWELGSCQAHRGRHVLQNSFFLHLGACILSSEKVLPVVFLEVTVLLCTFLRKHLANAPVCIAVICMSVLPRGSGVSWRKGCPRLAAQTTARPLFLEISITFGVQRARFLCASPVSTRTFVKCVLKGERLIKLILCDILKWNWLFFFFKCEECNCFGALIKGRAVLPTLALASSVQVPAQGERHLAS